MIHSDEIIRFAKLGDVPYIVDLSKKESHCLGFIPKMAYESAITGIKKGKRWSNVCNDRIWVCEINGDLVGFVLASFGRPNENNRFGKIAQICLQNDARKFSRGNKLLTKAMIYGYQRGVVGFKCGCADDLESNLFWKAMNFKLIYKRKGISHNNTWKQTSDRVINIYSYELYQLFPDKGLGEFL